MAKALDGGMEFQDALLEQRGAMAKGRLKFMDTSIMFKSTRTGKVEQIASTDIDVVTWQRFAGHWGFRLFTKNGALHRFGGFREADKEKIAKIFTSKYNNSMLDKELCLRGWNWGTAKFQGSVLSFDVAKDLDFEVPLNYVSQCLTAKNEVTLEFHQNDDAPVSLMELRFHIPSSELAGDDPVENFKDQVMGKASIISAVGDAIAIFREVQCLTPRGRYDIKIFQTFFQLHGKTFDYKIPMSTVLRLFLLPHKDQRQMFFMVSLDPPIKQGQTRYHYLTFLFGQEEDVTIELPLSEEELKKKYDGKLEKEISGPLYDVIGKIMKTLVSRKITVPGSFKGHSSTPAIGCSYKAAAGYLYPLERGFIYVHKPPLHIRFEELNSVNFARSGGSTRSFDFEVETKSGVVHTFSSIEKEEYPKLFDFISEKKLRVKNRGKLDNQPYTGDFDDSDAEAEPDAYLARVKAEAQERSDDESLEDESEDEDYNPEGDAKKQKAEDSGGSSGTGGSSDEEEGTDPDEIGSDMDTSPKKKKEKKPRKEKKEGGDGGRKKKRGKKDKDPNAPKRPMSAYFLWLGATRESLKKKFPGFSLTEFSKKAGEEWKTIDDKAKWEGKAKKAREEYDEQMREYKKSGGGASSGGGGGGSGGKSSSSSKSKSKSPQKKADTSAMAGSKGYLSKEFISDDSSSSDDGGKKKSKKKPAGKDSGSKGDAKAKSKKKASESEPEASATGSESDGGSGSGSDD